MPSRYRVPVVTGTALLVAALAGCAGSSTADSGDQGSGSGSGAQQQGTEALTITEPKSGADVQAPFTLKFTTKEVIGPEETGKDHVHVYLDGKEQDYEVVTTNQYQIKNISPGQHKVDVALQHADHSPVGPKAEISVNVTGGGGSGDTGGGGGGGGYDGGGGGGGY
jgi:hypothetical protein